jgi:hypothetical protein
VVYKAVSPQEFFDKACEYMLDGRRPETRDEWVEVANFIAYNLPVEICDVATMFVLAIFQCPLEDDEVAEIVAYQMISRLGEIVILGHTLRDTDRWN